jgi:hypothetical protein
VVTGAAALAGAIVGALAGGIAEYVLQRRREASDARAGARLLQAELSFATGHLESLQADQVWWVFFDMSLPSWDTYRGVLAAQLGRDAWMAVSQSVIELRRLGNGMVDDEATPPGGSFRLPNLNVNSIAAMRTNATRAYNAMCELADTEPEDLLPGVPPGEPRQHAR